MQKVYVFVCECGYMSIEDSYCEDCATSGEFQEYIPRSTVEEAVQIAAQTMSKLAEQLDFNLGL